MTKKNPQARPYNRHKPDDRHNGIVLVRKSGPGKWLCRCDCGALMDVQSGSIKGTRSCGRGACNSQWTDAPTYLTAHGRVRRFYGKATDQVCTCGSPARAWSYNHSGIKELIDEQSGSPYSADPGQYDALCSPCYRERDNAERRGLRKRIRELERQLADATTRRTA